MTSIWNIELENLLINDHQLVDKLNRFRLANLSKLKYFSTKIMSSIIIAVCYSNKSHQIWKSIITLTITITWKSLNRIICQQQHLRNFILQARVLQQTSVLFNKNTISFLLIGLRFQMKEIKEPTNLLNIYLMITWEWWLTLL